MATSLRSSNLTKFNSIQEAVTSLKSSRDPAAFDKQYSLVLENKNSNKVRGGASENETYGCPFEAPGSNQTE
ncbi:uncharacterized protein L201_000128 [Kwoniella dendrophila CBS 6074]|uniref:Uncharacterized protein n=1 Tax=Kwoniella dendrophila CBS 6074 TaxID=1295534 RepID=A0AAX4JJU3_9TREE